MEVELKLSLDPSDVAAFRRHPLLKQLAIAKPRTQQLVSIYFDTPDLHFRRHDAALRVRRVNRAWIQTLKGGGQVSAGLHQRAEWESRVGGPFPDLAVLRDLAGHDAGWRKILSELTLAERLVTIFTTRIRRTIWLLRSARGATIELALDQGEVSSGASSVPISEVELELKSGEPSELFSLALQLQHAVPLRLCDISKSQRGYALYAPQPSAVVKAARIELPAASSVAQGFQAVIGNCLTQILGNEIGVVQGIDPESVHQMRVGLRRLRAALGLFDTIAPCPAELHSELAWLSGKLGEARDWEVFAGDTLTLIANACPEQPEMRQLLQAAQAIAQANRQEAAAAVESARYSRLLLGIGGLTQGVHLREPVDRAAWSAALTDFSDRVLALAQAKLKKRGKCLKSGTPEARHRARIAAKKLRYAIEFFESQYPARQIRPHVKSLTSLQDALGSINDATVASELLRRLVSDRPELARIGGFIQGYLAARTEQDVRKLGKVWHRFKSMKLGVDAQKIPTGEDER